MKHVAANESPRTDSVNPVVPRSHERSYGSPFRFTLKSGSALLRLRLRCFVLFALFCAHSIGEPKINAQETGTLKLVKTIPLPGVNGRFDHFAIDVKGRRLFVAALGNNTLEVLDLNAGKRLHSVTGLHKPTGVLYLPDPNQICVANGDDGTFKMFDGVSYKLVNSLGSMPDADNVRSDAKANLIYVGYGEGALGVIDAASAKLIGSIPLPGHPESFQLEKEGSRIFVNVPDAKQIAVIDRNRRTATATWAMQDFQANFPMALDEANHRLYIGCRQPAQLVVLDSTTGKTVTSLEIAGDTDDLFYDAKSKRLYLSCGEGFVDVIDQRDANTCTLRERIPTSPGARTSFFSPDWNEFYLAVPMRANQSAEIRVFKIQM